MLLDTDALPSVDMSFMNEVHKEEVHIINHLFTALLAYENAPSLDNALVIDALFEKWYKHTVSHFEGEEVKMRESGFPPYAMHKGEHDRVLGEIRDLLEKWKESREPKPLKIYMIEVLPSWLLNHIQTMDTVTARFLKTGISPCNI
ncbi:hemerythrin family protein [Sulfurovum sp. zt1-1]|uniref:Hemerythrin family protein n=1 Tax=Sulfurovum zhangzhouensis TaxID=3019067 RepID=A0ABT7QY11_9BACT|nr:hemerythrin family protein [Sulfurovum zhangzhouensis]MDM5271725.1 hemerythrin family protein [Sulfurovum zhangzhouensis]